MGAADVHERKTFSRYFLGKKQAEGLPSPKNDLDIHKEICYGIRLSYNAINSKFLEKIDDCELVLELLNLIEKYTDLDSVCINVETWYALIDKDERFIEWADKTDTGYLALLVKYPDRFDEKRLIKIQAEAVLR